MNILYILGNGFDINLGLKTRYSDFYEHYKNIPSKSLLISDLKKEISNNLENWSDLELALGEYTQKLNSTEEFNEVFEDIGDELAEYLLKIESEFEYDKLNAKKLFDNLAFPERSLLTADSNALTEYKNIWSKHNWSINVMTLNYIQTIERIINYSGSITKIGVHNANVSVTLQRIIHIHGLIDKGMVMGVNDISQISNQSFHDKLDVTNALVKSSCNKALKHTLDLQCKKILNSANLICLFGSSLGKTDKLWWELIGNRLANTPQCQLIIFTKGDEIHPRRAYKIAAYENKIKLAFLDMTKLSATQKSSIISQITVGYNTDLFQLK